MRKSPDVQFVKSAAQWNDLPGDGRAEVAFVGRSNVGKSSLVNLLLQRKELARTSATPGKTRQFNYYLIDQSVYFVDIPGFGYARTSKTERDQWARFIARYISERESLRILFHLVDSRHQPTNLDLELSEYVKGLPLTYIIVLTKGDKLSGNERRKAVAQVNKTMVRLGFEVPVILASTVDKYGPDEIWNWIDSVAAPANPPGEEASE